MDTEKSMVGSSPSGTPSPRGALTGGNVGNNESSNGCVVASGTSGNVADSGEISSAAGESVQGTRTTTANVGAVGHSTSTSTVTASVAASSTWTSSSEGPAAGPGTSVSGGAGGIAATILGGSEAKNNGGRGSPHSPKLPRKSRVKLSELQLESATREEWAAKWREQDLYIECLEAQAAAQEGTEIKRARGTDVPRSLQNILITSLNTNRNARRDAKVIR